MDQTDRFITLSKGLFARVCHADWEQLSRYNWHATYGSGETADPYARRHTKRSDGRRPTIYMHRLLMHAPAGLVVNHRDGDTLNNTRSNLHLAHQRDNATRLKVRKGAIPYHGVNYRKTELGEVIGAKNVQARIIIGNKRVSLGSYETRDAAALAYDYAAVEAFGELAYTNFPLSDYLCAITLIAPAPIPEEIPW
jgi:hypothetical protein